MVRGSPSDEARWSSTASRITAICSSENQRRSSVSAASVDVVPFAAVCETRVVIGGYGVNHVGVRVVMCSQLKALRNDRPDVVRAVRGVEIFVSGNDFPFDISFEFLVHGCKGMKSL